jgi:DNA-binding XRE family transcriptional regulator
MSKMDDLVRLLKKGDAPSLTQLRKLLSIKRKDLASDIGIPEETLELWEDGKERPTSLNSALWKIKLGSHLDKKISTLLGTEDNEVTSKYWSLIWELVD